MKVNTTATRYTGEVIYGSTAVPKYGGGSTSGFSFTGSVPKKNSKEFNQLAGALKVKERTAVMVWGLRFGGKEAWDSFEEKLALRI